MTKEKTAEIVKEEKAEISTSELAQQAIAVRDKCLTFRVTDARSAEVANNGRREIKRKRKEYLAIVKPMVDESYGAWRKNKDRQNEIEKPLDQADSHLRTQIELFDEKMRMERRRIEEEARKAQEKKIQDALDAEEKGDTTAAEIALAEAAAEEANPAPIVTAPPDLEGSHFVKRWVYEITNPDIIERKHLIPNEAEFSAIARGLKGDKAIPPEIKGVRFYQKETRALR